MSVAEDAARGSDGSNAGSPVSRASKIMGQLKSSLDGYNDAAMAALTASWSSVDGGIEVACPELTGSMQVLQKQVRALLRDVRRLHTELSESRRQNQLTAELLEDLQNSHSHLKDTVDEIIGGAEGFVQLKDFRSELEKLTPRADVIHIESETNALIDDMRTRASKIEMENVRGALNALQHTYDLHCKSSQEVDQSMQEHAKEAAEEMKSSLSEQLEKITHLEANLLESQKRTLELMHTADEDLKRDVQLLRGETSENLSVTVSELLAHLKRHAAAIEALQSVKEEKMSNAPTKKELEELRSEMDGIRRAADDANFRVHEVYSQCMGMVASTADRDRPYFAPQPNALLGALGGTHPQSACQRHCSGSQHRLAGRVASERLDEASDSRAALVRWPHSVA